MSSFKNLFKAEMYKMTKGKSLIKLAIAMAILFIVFTLIFFYFNSLLEEFGVSDLSSYPGCTNEQMLENYKSNYEAAKANLEATDSNKLIATSLYQLKAGIVKYQFLVDNNISSSSIRDFGSLDSINANSYITFIMGIMSVVIIIYAIVQTARTMASELSNGTIKMQLLRPIERNQFIAAKYLSVITTSAILLLFMYIIAMIVGVIFFDVSIKSVLIVVDASYAIEASSLIEPVLYYLSYLFTIIGYVFMTIFLSNILNSKGMAVSIPIIAYLLASELETYLGYLYIGYAGFAVNLNWISALTLTGPTFNYMTVYSMILISFVWIGMFGFFAHRSFKRKDIQA